MLINFLVVLSQSFGVILIRNAGFALHSWIFTSFYFNHNHARTYLKAVNMKVLFIFSIWCWYSLVTDAINQMKARSIIATTVGPRVVRKLAMGREEMYISNGIQARFDPFLLHEIEKKFPLSHVDEQILSSSSVQKLRKSKQAHCIISLEGALLDTTPLFHHSFRILSHELGIQQPSSLKIARCCDLPLKECLREVQWPMDLVTNENVEIKLINIIEKVLRGGLRLELKPGALDTLNEWLVNTHHTRSENPHGQLSLLSNLPRRITTKLITANHALMKLFAPKNSHPLSLVALEEVTSTKEILFQCITKASKNPALVVLVDSNAETIRHAKHMGMACIGLSMNPSKYYHFSVADKVISSLDEMTIDAGLSAILGSFKCGAGAVAETASVADPPRKEIRTVSSSSLDRFRRPKDTFASEFESDRY